MRPRPKWRCEHTDRPYRALGLCNACYLKQNGGSARWYAKNRTKMMRNVKTWVKMHRVQRRRYSKLWARRAYRKNPLPSILRARINSALRHHSKSASLLVLIGCSIDQLKRWLGSQFLPGMSWKNHSRGGWHIDHRKPCAAFDLHNPSEQRRCFHYTNLQPMWSCDNLSKGKRI